MEKLKHAQELIDCKNSNINAGFNTFINGGNEPNSSDGIHWLDLSQGYDFAKKMAREYEIAFTFKFRCDRNKSCFPFNYGGFMVCNNCGEKGVDKEWWKIKVEKDGNEYCCHGLDFVNLQESNNYAFGKSFMEAIDNYEKVMLSLS